VKGPQHEPDSVFEKFSTAEKRISVTPRMYTTPAEPRYQVINNEAQQLWQQHAFMWTTTGHRSTPD